MAAFYARFDIPIWTSTSEDGIHDTPDPGEPLPWDEPEWQAVCTSSDPDEQQLFALKRKRHDVSNELNRALRAVHRAVGREDQPFEEEEVDRCRAVCVEVADKLRAVCQEAAPFRRQGPENDLPIDPERAAFWAQLARPAASSACATNQSSSLQASPLLQPTKAPQAQSNRSRSSTEVRGLLSCYSRHI